MPNWHELCSSSQCRILDIDYEDIIVRAEDLAAPTSHLTHAVMSAFAAHNFIKTASIYLIFPKYILRRAMVKYTESYILEALDILIVKPHQRRSTSPDQAKKKIIYQTGHQYVLMSRDLEGVEN